VAGVVLAVLALSPPREGGAWFPLQTFVRKNWGWVLVVAGLVAGAVMGIQALTTQRMQHQQARAAAEYEKAHPGEAAANLDRLKEMMRRDRDKRLRFDRELAPGTANPNAGQEVDEVTELR
jgi:hypothetical protein